MAKKLKRIDIAYKESKGRWEAKSGGRVVAKGTKKADVIADVTASAKKSAGTSVRIHKKNGQIQEERTYPRSADPRSSKG